MSFWNDFKKPIFVLAPMEDVTDTVFRQVIAKCGRPDVFFTEFTSVEGLNSEGRDEVAKRLQYTEIERPIVAQIWGITPENYYNSAKIIKDMGFDGVDINMGCPVKDVIKKGACSALIKNPSLAKEIYLATKEGAGGLPVSIKTRIGFREIQTEEWIGFLLNEVRPEVLTIHGRTVREKSKVPNHWDEIGKASSLRRPDSGQAGMKRDADSGQAGMTRDADFEQFLPEQVSGVKEGSDSGQEEGCHSGLDPESRNFRNVDTSIDITQTANTKTLIIGNGDISSHKQGLDLIDQYGLDGVMIGRGIFQNPWIFNPDIDIETISSEARTELLLFHTKLFVETWGDRKSFNILKKFFKIYIQGFRGAKDLRIKLMETNSYEEVVSVVNSR